MARNRFIYLLERIRDGVDWPAGSRIWADRPFSGWRVVKKELI